MQKTFVSNLAILLLLNLVVKPLWVLGIDVQVQRILGPADYGMYFDLLSFSFLFMALFDFGLNIYNNRLVAHNPEEMSTQVVRIGSLKLLMGAGVLILMHVIALFLAYDEQQMLLLSGTGAIIFLSSFLMFLRGNISGIQWYRADVLLSVLDRFLAISLCATLIWGGITGFGLDIGAFILVQVVAYSVSVIVATGLLMSKGAKLRFSLNLAQARNMLKASFPFMLLTFLMVSYHRMDVVMIERMLPEGAREAGLYAQAYKLLDASVMFAYLFSTLLLPMFSRMFKEKKPKELEGLVRLAETLMLVPAFIAVIAAVIYSRDLMDLLYLEGVSESAAAFGVLMMALIPIAITYIYGTLITAEGNLRTLNIIAAIGAVVNIIGNYFLINTYGIWGAAVMTLATQSIIALIQVIYAHKTIGLDFGRRQWRNLLLTIFLFPLWCRLNVELFTDWRIEIVVYLFGGLILALLTGLFSVKKLKQVLALKEG